MEDYTISKLARRDLSYNAIPGTDKFTPGQLSILQQEIYHPFFTIFPQMVQLENNVRDIRNEIIAYQTPVDELIKSGNQIQTHYQSKIASVNDSLVLTQQSKDQFEENVFNRGFIEYEEAEIIEETSAETENKNFSMPQKIKNAWKWLFAWILGELFMTISQYKSLQYEKGTIDMLIRSGIFGIVLGLVHKVFFKEDKKKVHYAFMIFSLCMIAAMLLVPVVLNEMYPPTFGAATQAWSLTETPAAIQNITPRWVEAYRNNDWLPGIFCYFFYLIMQIFSKDKDVKKEDKKPGNKSAADSIQTEIKSEIYHHKRKIDEKKFNQKELEETERLKMQQNTDKLYDIFKVIEQKEAQELKYMESVKTLLAEKQILLNNLKADLTKYQCEYTDALNNDIVKCNFIRPEWAAEETIINHYK